MPLNLDPNRPVGYESRKSYARRCREGFWDAFIAGPAVLDIGYRGGAPDAVPIVDGAIGVELYHVNIHGNVQPWASSGPNSYDGLNLPIPSYKIDTVYSSHVLEHVRDPIACLQEWHRVLRNGGTMIIVVPSAFLYERRLTVPPSRWSPEHLRSYVPSTLLRDVEDGLLPNSYQVSALFTDDTGYDYDQPTELHPVGCLEIVLVLRRQPTPSWKIDP